MNINLDQTSQQIPNYIQKIKAVLVERLKTQLNGTIKTDRGDYEIVKFGQIGSNEIYLEEEKLHNLFSPNAFKIQGTITIKIQAYTPNSSKDSYTSHIFAISFKPTSMKFHHNEEIFSIEENINISSIIVKD